MSKELIVCKFGGTSLADADQFRKVADIIKKDGRRRVVVVSAPGKGKNGEPKVTDLLLQCHQLEGEQQAASFQAVSDRILAIAEGLGLKESPRRRLQECLGWLRLPATRDAVASWGEWLSAHLLAEHLGWVMLEASDVIRFTVDGTFDQRTTYGRLREAILPGTSYVIPGFYGSLPDGAIKTFDRGGSDITGGIVAAALEASLYENWTDVSGVMQTDPRIVPRAKPIERLTYQQVRELAYMGASVLHYEAMQPCRERSIPIRIRNTNRPEDPGTLIHAESFRKTPQIVGIAGKKWFTTVTVERSLMNDEIGVGRRVLAVFERNGVPYEHMPTSIDAIEVVVPSDALRDRREAVLVQIRHEIKPDRLDVEEDLALISVVGDSGWATSMRESQLFWALWSRDISPRLHTRGANQQSLILGVRMNEFERAIQALAAIAFAS